MDKFKQLDQVRIITTANVGWVSATPGQVANPKGIWIVVGILQDALLLHKDETLAKVPIIDVVKVAEYNISQPLKAIEDLLHVKRRRDDPIKEVNDKKDL